MIKINPGDEVLISKYWQDICLLQFELSHQCPNRDKHTQCPLHLLAKEFDGMLPSSVVFELCESLKLSGNTNATIMFHLYNEPTSDSRLCWMVHHIRHVLKMPNTIKLHSSTVNMNEVLMNDLISCGVNHLTFTIPDAETYDKYNGYREKFMAQYPDLIFRIYMSRYDNRMNVYDGENLKAPLAPELVCEMCTMPDNDRRITDPEFDQSFKCAISAVKFIVGCDGKIALCEYDWRKTPDLGNVYTDSLLDIFKKKLALHHKLHVLGSKEACPLTVYCPKQVRLEKMVTPCWDKLNATVGRCAEIAGTIRHFFTDKDVQGIGFMGRRYGSVKELLAVLNLLYLQMGATNSYQVAFILAIPVGEDNRPTSNDVPVYFVHAIPVRDKWKELIKSSLGADLIDSVNDTTKQLVFSATQR